MTSAPERILVACPKCSFQFETWFRASMNLDLDDFPDSYIRRMSTAKCPLCKTRFDLGGLVVEGGAFYVRGE